MLEHEKENLKDSKSRNDLRIIAEYIGSHALIAVPVFAIVGFLISSLFKLTMNNDVWFWFFSSIAQTFAALVALVGLFLISRIDSYNAIINKNMEIIRRLMNEFAADDYCDYFTDSEALMRRIEELIPKLRVIIAEKPVINKLDSKDIKFIESIKSRAVFLIRAKEEIDELKQKKEQTNNQMRTLLEHTVSIIILSIFLIPFGSVKSEDYLMLALWNYYDLKWVIIFGVVGLCIVSLHKVKSLMMEFLSGYG